MGTYGKTPLYHVLMSTRHNMDQDCFDLLLSQYPVTVVHCAIRDGLLDWDDMQEMVRTKINSLTVEDDDSGLLPFMMAGEKCSYESEDLSGLSLVYELLSMKPDVMNEYDHASYRN